MDLALRQKDLAARFGTSVCNVVDWETNRTNPSIRYVPQITRFLGYSPVDTSRMTLGQRIHACRKMLGLSQRKLARRLGVHPDTVASWEQDRHRPVDRQKEGLLAFLSSAIAERRPRQ